MMKWTNFLLLWIGISLNLNAQINIIGSVKSEDTQEQLNGATIIFMGDFTIGTVTDDNGAFSIIIPNSNDEIELLIQYIGFDEKIIIVSKDNFETLDIFLKQSAVNIDEITVSARPVLGEEFVVKEILKLEIYTNPNSRADPIRAVNCLASSTSVDETASLSLRGSPPGETAYVFNRVPISNVFKLDQSNGVGQFSIFNTSIISKVDVYPSNPPLQFGGSSSGLIALYADEIASSNTKSINLTMAGVGLKMDQKINNKNGLALFTNFNLNKGLKKINKKAFENLKSFYSFDAGAYWVSVINERTKLKLFNYSLSENYAYRINLPSYDGFSLQQKIRNQTVFNLERKLGQNANFDFNQGINFSKGKFDYGNTSHRLNKKDFFSSFNISRFSDFFSLGIGISINMHFVDNEGKYPAYFWALANQHPTIAYNTNEAFFLPEFYTHQKFRFTENFILGISNRKTIAPSNNVKEFNSNQFNLSYLHNDNHSLKASFGTYHKLFIPGEQFYKTRLVSSRHYSLDYSYKKERIELNAAMYHKKTQYESEDLNIIGAELFAAYENEKLETSLSISHVKAEMQTADFNYPSKHDLCFFFRHLLKYKLGPHLELNSVLFLRSGSYFDPVLSANYHDPTRSYEPFYSNVKEMQKLPNYSIWDLSLSKISQVADGVLIVFVSASNVLDKKNVRGPQYNENYQQVGNQFFGSRVFFMGAVYNWN